MQLVGAYKSHNMHIISSCS